MRAQEFVKNLDEVSMGVSEFNVAIEQGTAILAEQQLDELLDLDTISDIGNALPNFIHKLVHVYATEATETVHTARLLIDKLLSGEPLSPEEKFKSKNNY